MQAVTNEPFLNTHRNHPNLFLQNLETISQLGADQKLYFHDHGIIEIESNSYYRATSGKFWSSISSFVPATLSSGTERDIRHLEQFAGALSRHFSLHVLPKDRARQYNATLEESIGALYNLCVLYRTEQKHDNLKVVERTIDSFKDTKLKIIETTRRKEELGTYRYFIERLKFIKIKTEPPTHLAQMIPMLEDLNDEICCINNSFINRVIDVLKSRTNIFTTDDRIKALATIFLEESDFYI